MATAAQIETRMDAAAAAIADGDYATAISQAMAAQGLLAAIPDSEHHRSGLKWDREAVSRFIADARRQQGAAAGVQRSNITRSEPGLT